MKKNYKKIDGKNDKNLYVFAPCSGVDFDFDFDFDFELT
jgi:hypothetical protein